MAGAFPQRGDEDAHGLVVDGGVRLAQVEVQLHGALGEEQLQQEVAPGKKQRLCSSWSANGANGPANATLPFDFAIDPPITNKSYAKQKQINSTARWSRQTPILVIFSSETSPLCCLKALTGKLV